MSNEISFSRIKTVGPKLNVLLGIMERNAKNMDYSWSRMAYFPQMITNEKVQGFVAGYVSERIKNLKESIVATLPKLSDDNSALFVDFVKLAHEDWCKGKLTFTWAIAFDTHVFTVVFNRANCNPRSHYIISDVFVDHKSTITEAFEAAFTKYDLTADKVFCANEEKEIGQNLDS